MRMLYDYFVISLLGNNYPTYQKYLSNLFLIHYDAFISCQFLRKKPNNSYFIVSLPSFFVIILLKHLTI